MQAYVFLISVGTVLVTILGTLDEVSGAANPCMLLNYFTQAITTAKPTNVTEIPQDLKKEKEKIIETFFQKLMKWEPPSDNEANNPPNDIQQTNTKSESNNSEDKNNPPLSDKGNLESKDSPTFQISKTPLKDLISNYIQFMTYIFSV